MMKVEWEIRTNPEPGVLEQMEIAAEQAVLTEGIHADCEIHVCLCDDETIAEINQEFRGIPSSTDVLSFPSVSWPRGKTAGSCESLLKQEYDDETRACFLGDIVISVQHMTEQAHDYGHSVIREGCYLLVHGLCHLMGYDHIEDADRLRMRSAEERILTSIGIVRDEAAGSVSDEVLLRAARAAAKASYSPYSDYPVGAALLSSDGRIFTGCNVENASYGLTMCAERVALFKAVSEGARSFKAIAVSARNVPWPCGACRQALNEFSPEMRIMVTWGDRSETRKLEELLPESFGPENLQ